MVIDLDSGDEQPETPKMTAVKKIAAKPPASLAAPPSTPRTAAEIELEELKQKYEQLRATLQKQEQNQKELMNTPRGKELFTPSPANTSGDNQNTPSSTDSLKKSLSFRGIEPDSKDPKRAKGDSQDSKVRSVPKAAPPAPPALTKCSTPAASPAPDLAKAASPVPPPVVASSSAEPDLMKVADSEEALAEEYNLDSQECVITGATKILSYHHADRYL